MVTVSAEQAQEEFVDLLTRVEAGEEVIITREGRAVGKLVAYRERGKRQFGSLKGRIKLDDSFFDPLPEEELKAWEGG
ncbi:MAG: type II toxin-antitoxin system prevent-host-death family antitoxin [Chloroflexi bacterium]|nr:type II toxin-antitoxin system prevent-host-death family antitoxin [Chloroflexota bacterium]